MNYEVYQDLSYEQIQNTIHTILDPANSQQGVKFILSHPQEKEFDSDNSLNEANLEERLHGP